MRSVLKVPVGLGTDWNSLLEGAGPRFGPRSAHGLGGEVEASVGGTLKDAVRTERRDDAKAQAAGVLYDTDLRDWGKHRFDDPSLYEGTPIAEEGHHLWHARAIVEIGVDTATAEAREPLDEPVREVLHGVRGEGSMATTPAGADCFRAGQLWNDTTAVGAVLTAEGKHVEALVLALREIDGLWSAMRTAGGPVPALPALPGPPQSARLVRSTAGPIRDFDYNLDGLAHYGMTPGHVPGPEERRLPDRLAGLALRVGRAVPEVWEASDAAGKALADPIPR